MSESVRHRIGDRSFDKFFATSECDEFCKRLEVAYSNKNDAVAKSEIAAIVPKIMKSPMLRRNAVVLPFIARSVLKVLEDKPLAEQFYLDLYFCDPHYYDGEFAEWRINHRRRKMRMRFLRKLK